MTFFDLTLDSGDQIIKLWSVAVAIYVMLNSEICSEPRPLSMDSVPEAVHQTSFALSLMLVSFWCGV